MKKKQNKNNCFSGAPFGTCFLRIPKYRTCPVNIQITFVYLFEIKARGSFSNLLGGNMKLSVTTALCVQQNSHTDINVLYILNV